MKFKPHLIKDLTDVLDDSGCSYRLLTETEVSMIDRWWEQHFPFASWGRLQWDAVPDHICREWEETWGDLVDEFHNLCDTEDLQNPEVIVVWSNGLAPSIACSLHVVRDHAMAVFDEDFDTWILCISDQWCIEVYHEGELCFGKAIVPSST